MCGRIVLAPDSSSLVCHDLFNTMPSRPSNPLLTICTTNQYALGGGVGDLRLSRIVLLDHLIFVCATHRACLPERVDEQDDDRSDTDDDGDDANRVQHPVAHPGGHRAVSLRRSRHHRVHVNHMLRNPLLTPTRAPQALAAPPLRAAFRRHDRQACVPHALAHTSA